MLAVAGNADDRRFTKSPQAQTACGGAEGGGIEPGLPPRQGGVFPLDHEPVVSVDLIGVEPITPILQGSVASIGMQAHLDKRSVRELNPVFRLTTAADHPVGGARRNTYRPFVKSDPGWNRTSTFLDVGQAS